MKSEEDKIIRSEHEDGSVHGGEESAEFVPGYQPERMTKITVPGLPDDASGMSAEALAKIPTLTERVSHADDVPKPAAVVAQELVIPVLVEEHAPEVTTAAAIAPAPAPAPAQVHVAETVPEQAAVSESLPAEPAFEPPAAQDTPIEADSWLEQCQARIGQLSDEIHKLNDRLDQLEQPTKV